MSDTVKLSHCPNCGSPIPAAAPQGLCPKCILQRAASATETGAGATATSEIPSLQRVAAAFPQLEIIELIGRGGMGFVFKARQPRLDRLVALKLLPDKLARDPRFAERFNREGRVLAKLNHPNIVSVFDFGQTEHFYFLLMEFVDGVNLRQAMQAGRFSPAEALAVVPRICEALQYAHTQGVLHRDIKPENILLDAHGHVKIADFGIAKLVGEEHPDVSLTATGAALGTPHYMAPEQFEKPSEVDHRADIYSLGVVFYEMLTGELPIGRFAAPSAKTPVGANVDEVVFRTLEKDRERRYQSAGEMQTQVEHLTGPQSAPSASAPPKLPARDDGIPEWSQMSVVGAALTTLSLALPLLTAFLLSNRRHSLGGPGALLLSAAILLPGLLGLLLGWISLSDIRAHQGRLRGLPFAVFAALAWPLLLLVGATSIVPYMFLRQASAPGTQLPLAGILSLCAPAGTITFAAWAVFAAARWAGHLPAPHRRGILKWIFLGLLLAFSGILYSRHVASRALMMEPAMAEMPATEEAAASNSTVPTVPWIRFTFTAVELRQLAGVRWLAIDYVDDVHGHCQKAFPWTTDIPGFTAQTRTSEFLKDAADSPTVRHQRVEFRIPDSIPLENLDCFRTNVEHALLQKSIRMELDENQPRFLLFELPGAEGGSLKAWLKVIPLFDPPPLMQPSPLDQARESAMRARQQAANFTPPNSPFSFGPVRERVLPEPGPDVACLLDFETGELLKPSDALGHQLAAGIADIGDEAVKWLRDSRADAAINMPNAGSLRLFEGVALSFARDHRPPLRWDQFTPSDVVDAIGQAGWERSRRFENSGNVFYATPAVSPDALAFITREGTMGVMEILGLNTSPPGVKIRYKLLKISAPNP